MKELTPKVQGVRLTPQFATLFDEAKHLAPTAAIRDELVALYSHWLQDPTSNLRLPDARGTTKWRELLIESRFLPRPRQKSVVQEQQLLFRGLIAPTIPFPPPEIPRFKFIDLFAGIGGFRLALQSLGGKCVFSSEWDTAAQATYFQNYGELPFGDIRQFTNPSISDDRLKLCIPDHDILCAGFPCQPFSHAGVSARTSLGRSHGFECSTQGTLFFDLIRIAKCLRPKVLLLENVRNLVSHDKGNTFRTIEKTITEDLGYSFNYKIVDARTTVPQKRVRCFMVCFRDPEIDFTFPTFDGQPKPLKSILEPASTVEDYTISDRMWAGHQRRTKTNIARGAGFTTYAAKLDEPANTIVARYWKDGKECLVPQPNKNPRTLTPRECARLQGYPETFVLPDKKKHAYMQMGNSVVVPVIKRIAENITKKLNL
ncbi:DNA cytosine methyltransferase [Verrucomicrobiaceae bacterium 227]